jgi:uncharacterized cupredoxin-like copper-binding protein
MKANAFARLLAAGITLATGTALSLPAVAHVGGHPNSAHAAGHPVHSSDAGQVGEAAQVTRSVVVGMYDSMRFTPATITVKRGETVRFVVANRGQVLHELVLGSVSEIDKLRALVKTDPHKAHVSDNMVHVSPGEKGEFIWKFTQAGTFTIACLLPGHFESGMVGAVEVTQ